MLLCSSSVIVYNKIKKNNTKSLCLENIDKTYNQPILEYEIKSEINYKNKKIESKSDIKNDEKQLFDKYYKFIKKYNSYSNPLTESEIIDILNTIKKCNVDGALLLAIASVESSFNKNAVSKAGCIGIMQINPIHKKEYNFTIDDLYDPCKNIIIADKIITKWLKNSSNITLSDICRKYLGVHSDKYLNKVINRLNELN